MADTTLGPATYPRTARATSVRAACAGLLDDMPSDAEYLSVYLVVDGRLRCQSSRGYFQVFDGFGMSTGIIGRVVSSGQPALLEDVSQVQDFLAAVPGIRSEVCVPLWVHGHVVGAVNQESRSVLDAATIESLTEAAEFLGGCLELLGGLARPSLAERVARHAVALARQTDHKGVREHVLGGAVDVSTMSSAAIASLSSEGRWAVDLALGPLARVLQGWDDRVLRVLTRWVWAGTSSHFPDGSTCRRSSTSCLGRSARCQCSR